MSGSRRVELAVAALAGALLLASCGLPSDGTARPVEPADVPFGLLDAGGQPSATPSGVTPSAATAAVAFLDANGEVVLRPESFGPLDPATLLQRVLDELALGPDERDRSAGLLTALPPSAQLRLTRLDGGVATVETQGLDEVTEPEALPLAAAQVVLTATSVTGVTAVWFTRDGSPVAVPLPDGTTTSQPLTVDLVRGVLKPDG